MSMPLTKLELLAIYIYQPELFPAAMEQAANDYDRYMIALVTTTVKCQFVFPDQQ